MASSSINRNGSEAPAPALRIDQLIDKVKGCIFGAALGDAFGLATEFMTKNEARRFYGLGPIKFGQEDGFPFVRDAFRIGWQENDFTDDTDQMLLLLNSALETDGIVNPRHFAFRLHEWATNGFPELDKPSCGIGFTIGSTITHSDFRSDPHHASYLVWNEGGRESASNGAVMRTSALGIVHFQDEERVVENAINAAKVTHADPRSVACAVIVSVLISRLLRESAQNQAPLPIDRKRIAELLTQGSGQETARSHRHDEHQTPVPALKSLKTLSIERRLASARLVALFNRFKELGGAKEEWGPYQLANPVHKFSEDLARDPDPRIQNPVSVSVEARLATSSMDSLGSDPEMTRIISEVVNDYKFMLTDNEFCPSPSKDKEGAVAVSDFIREMEFYSSVNSLTLSQLHRGWAETNRDIGYSLKCLGYGLYCSSRAIPPGTPPSTFFKSIMTELALEGGDADTNGAVAGSILGCRLGMHGLPVEWTTGLRHVEYLNELVEGSRYLPARRKASHLQEEKNKDTQCENRAE